MRVLITGGAGFIGSHTTDALIGQGCAVRILDSLEEPVHPGNRVPDYLHPQAELLRGDVRDPQTLAAAMRGCDVIYHFAAYQDYLPTYSRFFDVNVGSTALIYELIEREKFPIRKVIVASSQAALGEGLYCDADGREVLPGLRPLEQLQRGIWEIQPPAGTRGPLRWQITDERVANPQNPYGMSKIAEESVALHLGRRCDVPSVAMRYSIVQGPRQSLYNAYSGACRVFCLSFHVGREPTIYEDGQQVRDFVNIQDVVDANLLVLHDPRADFQMFNVAGGKAITVNEFATATAQAYERRNYVPRPSGTFRFGDTRHICSSIEKLGQLGWRPMRGIAESIASYRDWLRSSDVAGDVLDYCNRQMARLQVVRATDLTAVSA